MAISLTEGSLSRLLAGDEKKDSEEKPVVQILGVRKMNQKGPQDRFRMIVSDGVNSIHFAMLATQLNPKVESGDLVENAIIKLNHCIMSRIKDKAGHGERKVIIVLEVEVIVPGSEVNVKIGNPVALSEDHHQQQQPTVNKENGMNNAAHNPPPPPAASVSKQPAAYSPPVEQQPPKRPRLDSGVSEANIRPISSINPFQNKWVIKARVVAKPPVRTWQNQRGEGKLFSMDLKDKSGEIRATAFNEEVDKFFEAIEVGKVYLIGNCSVKTANKKFSSIKNDYEISFNRETFVSEADDAADVPTVTYDNKEIKTIMDAEVDSLIDIVAVIHSYSDIQQLVSRASGKELKKRDVILVDESGHSVSLTLWNKEAENFNEGNHIIAIRNAKVGQYQNAKNLSTLMSSNIVFNPDIPAAHRLGGWYENGGKNVNFVAISSMGGGGPGGVGGFEPWKSLSAIKDERLGTSDKADYFGCVASVISFKRENFYYLACPSDDCKKKLIDNGDGVYRCEKCNKDYHECNVRMILSANIADWSNNIWVTFFDKEAQLLLGVDGKEMVRMKDEESEKFNAVFDKLRFTEVQLKLRVKTESYNDEQRTKTSIVNVEKLNVAEHNKRLLKEIAEMRAQLSL